MVKTKEITLSVPDCTLGELIRWLQQVECCTVTSSATTLRCGLNLIIVEIV